MRFALTRRTPRGLVWFIVPLVLVGLVAFAYRDAPKNVFHFDDGLNISRHPPIMIERLTAESVLNAGRESFLPSRPLPSMTFAVDWWRGNGSPKAFQQTNVAIHAASSLVIFALLFTVLLRTGHSESIAGLAAFIAAALWACHPIHVQAVTYIVQRMASMAAFFTVLTVLLYILGRGKNGWRSALLFTFAGVFWVLGLASKETAAIAPFLVLLAEYGVVRHGQNLIRTGFDRVLLALPAIIGILVVVDIWSGAGPLSDAFLPGYEIRDFTLGERLLTQPRVIAFHISQILWPLPVRFSLEHDLPVSVGLFSPAQTFTAFAAVVTWCVAGIWALFQRQWRVIGFFLLWLPATLVIESTFIPLEMVFEHRMYMASVGLAGLASLGLASVMTQYRLGLPMVLGVSVIVAALLIVSTSQRVPIWQSTLRLAEANVERAPNNARSWSTLASVLHNAGRGWSEVMPLAAKSLELNPYDYVAAHLQAIYFVENQRFDEASEILDRLTPDADRDHSVFNTIGMLRLGQGDYQAAIIQFEKVVHLDGFKPEFKYNLALSYELAGRCEEALVTWQIYLEQETNAQRIARVRQRLKRNFETEGGRCFDTRAPRP